MSFKFITATPILAACAAAGAIALAGPASAAQEECTTSATSTVCESPGSASIVAAPGDTAASAGDQNGMYGPAGDVPPVGRGN